MINFLVNWQDVNNGVIASLRMLLLKLCEPVYGLIVFCFDIFEDFGELRLFEESNTVSMIYNRVGLLLGLFMVFRITFAAIEYLVDPDKILDSKQGIGNVVKRVIITVILLGSTRYLFNFAFDFQNKIIENDVIGNLILGPNYSEESKYSTGTNIAWFTFTQFYVLNDRAKTDENYEDCSIMLESGDKSNPNSGGSIYIDFHDNHKFNNAEYCINLKTNDKYSMDSNIKEKQQLNIIDFNGFICLAVGGILLWTIMLYTIQVAIRVFQLAYLELISPIPIMMYIMPKGDEKLKKWAQQCLITFLDFFIRLAIMDFVILVSNALIDLEDTDIMLVNFNKLSFWGAGYVKIILILGLFAFIKKVPALLKEIFPSTGSAAGFDYGLKMPEDIKKTLGFGAKTLAGGLAGGAVGLIGGGAKGFLGGLAKGTIGGAKGKKWSEIASARAAQNRINRQAKREGSTFAGRSDARIRNLFGFDSRIQEIDNQIHDIDINKIRPIDDEISKIDNSAIMEKKRKNDVILGAKKAMMDEAEKELLKAGSGNTKLRAQKEEIEKAKKTFAEGGKMVFAGETAERGITAEDIVKLEDKYKNDLDSASSKWIDDNVGTNSVIATNMGIISNETGKDIAKFGEVKSVCDAAKAENTANAKEITELEFRKQQLEKEKSEHESAKKQLERQKEIPQADENAIKKQ